MPSGRVVRLGTRGSALARWQTDHVAGLLRSAHHDLAIEVVVITTQGDRVIDKPLAELGGKGAFTAELESALRGGAIDYAVHSLKDLPTEPPEGLVIGAIPQRGSPTDALISRAGYTLATLPKGAAVGTGSGRRAAQLLSLRPDLTIVDIRGNVDTRIRKALDPDGEFDAIVLAVAGLERLDRLDVVSQRLSLDEMMPAPGQGALAVQCRATADALDLLSPIHHAPTAAAVSAERAFLAGLGSGCALPVAAYGALDGDRLVARGRVIAPDGTQQVDVSLSGSPDAAETLGYQLADQALARGLPPCWIAGMSLTGKRIVNTRSAEQAGEFDARLRAAGAIPLAYPCIAILPPEDTDALDRALAAGEFDLVALTSANAVTILAQRAKALGLSLKGVRAAAVGAATAQAARDALGVEIAAIPEMYSADALAEAISVEPGMRILLPQSALARSALARRLRERGAHVAAVAAYRTTCGSGGVDLPALLREGLVDAVTFTSPSTVRFFVERLAGEGGTLIDVPVACIGAQTSHAAREHDLAVAVEANPHTLDGLIAGLAAYL